MVGILSFLVQTCRAAKSVVMCCVLPGPGQALGKQTSTLANSRGRSNMVMLIPEVAMLAIAMMLHDGLGNFSERNVTTQPAAELASVRQWQVGCGEEAHGGPLWQDAETWSGAHVLRSASCVDVSREVSNE